MTPFLLYQLKVAGSLAAFTLLFYLLFRKETFYRFNRFYLLASIVLSHLLPVVKLPIHQVTIPATIADYGDFGAVDYTAIARTNIQTVPAVNIPQLVYGLIAGIIALYLIYQLISMVALVIRKNATRLGNFRLILLPEKNQSFSFFNLIFLHAVPADATQGNQVLEHELAHARQLHSLDIFIIQVVKIFQWFNPFIYLTEKAMQETHEYLADQAVMEQNGGIDQYRLLLLTQVFGIQPGIFSYFNYSLIKNRLIMMTKEKSPFRNRLKYVTALPLVLVLGYVICPPLVYPQDPDKSAGKNEKTVVSPQLPQPPSSPEPPPVPTPEQIENFKAQERENATEGHAFIFVDQQARFQGGTLEDFRQWIQKNLVYPRAAKENGITGKVMVQFAVNAEGKISDVKVIKGVDPSLDNETVRVIHLSPAWTPARNDGKKVAQMFVMPVIFSLEKKQVAGNSPEQVIVEKQLQGIPENQQGEPAFLIVEQQAAFQGGSFEQFKVWVQEHLVYPATAKEDGIFGRVTLQFAVNSQGKVCDVKVLRGVDPSLDQEAVRVTSSSPDWIPAKQSGKNVRQQFVMPVVFTLGNKELPDFTARQYPDVLILNPAPDVHAKFQGGDIFAFYKWAQQHLIYPPEAKKNKITGEVLVSFAVSSTGQVTSVKVSKSTNPLFDAEAIRVIESSPAWEPAKKDGKNVDQNFLLNVSFALK